MRGGTQVHRTGKDGGEHVNTRTYIHVYTICHVNVIG